MQLPEELQAEIRELARRLPELTYYELLGVPADADPGQLRDGFFARSKRYHPDRYFGKELGPYAGLLTEIYKRIAVAHDVLRDPAMRRQYDESTAKRDPVPAPRPADPQGPPGHDGTDEDTGGAARARPAGAAPPRGAAPVASLRTRAGLRPPDFGLRSLKARLRASSDRARAHYDEGKALAEQLQWSRAADKLRLAVALDPKQADHQDALADVLSRLNDQRMVELERDARRLIARGDTEAAIDQLVELAELKPADHALAARIAELLLEVRGDVARALRYAKCAVEVEPENAAYGLLLARLLTADGSPEAARLQLERALIQDPENAEVKAELRALGRAAKEEG